MLVSLDCHMAKPLEFIAGTGDCDIWEVGGQNPSYTPCPCLAFRFALPFAFCLHLPLQSVASKRTVIPLLLPLTFLLLLLSPLFCSSPSRWTTRPASSWRARRRTCGEWQRTRQSQTSLRPPARAERWVRSACPRTRMPPFLRAHMWGVPSACPLPPCPPLPASLPLMLISSPLLASPFPPPHNPHFLFHSSPPPGPHLGRRQV
jgi:hypothetical protein